MTPRGLVAPGAALPRRLAFALLALAFVLATFGGGAEARDALAGRGPKVGERIPHSLAAPDQDGRRRDFGSLTGARGLVLLFNRSLDWCVYCKAQARAWNERLDEVAALGYALAAVSYDSVEDLARYARRYRIRYRLLSDPESEIIRAFDVLNERHAPGSRGHGIPHPIIFVLDAGGTVTHRFSEASYRDRPEINLVLEALRGG